MRALGFGEIGVAYTRVANLAAAFRAFVLLRRAGAPIYHVCGGPNGEFSMDLASGGRLASIVYDGGGALCVRIENGAPIGASPWDGDDVHGLLRWLRGESDA